MPEGVLIRPNDVRFGVPILSPAEVAALVGMPRSTVYSWMRATPTRPALVHSFPASAPRRPTIPLIGLAEASVIRALRTSKMKMPEIAAAISYLRQEYGEFALGSPELVHDGVSALLRNGSEIVTLLDGQGVLLETVAQNLSPFRLAQDGYVQSFVVRSLGNVSLGAEYEMEIDPRFSAGRMRFTRTGVPVYTVTGLLQAGEEPGVVANEFDLTLDEVGHVREHLPRLSEVA